MILPHGVLFRGGAEAAIRKRIVRQGYIKGIIGLPANLFYGTGIPACILVLDKEDAAGRRGIFMVDASKGFIKDGNKNRLRAQDIHKIVDTFNRQVEIPRYSRMVPLAEIEANDFNLNLPRYIDSTEPEDLQDIDAHLKGGIPNRDIDGLAAYWQVFPSVRRELFERCRPPRLQPAEDRRRPDQGRDLRPCRVHRVQPAGQRAVREVEGGQHAAARWYPDRRPAQGADRDRFREPAGHLPPRAADRPLRRLPAPDGLLGRDDAGRRLADRPGRLEGRAGGQAEYRPDPRSADRRPLLRRRTGRHRAARSRARRHQPPDGGTGRGARRRGWAAGRSEDRQGQAHRQERQGPAQGHQGRQGGRTTSARCWSSTSP